MKKQELRSLIKEEIKSSKNNEIKEKLKKAIEVFKRSGKTTKEAVLDFLEGFLRNIDD